jgi:light-independent protochlorophyllide reductase subunit L
MDETPDVKAVQNEYLRIAATLAAGVPAQPGTPLRDREIFDLLGYD